MNLQNYKNNHKITTHDFIIQNIPKFLLPLFLVIFIFPLTNPLKHEVNWEKSSAKNMNVAPLIMIAMFWLHFTISITHLRSKLYLKFTPTILATAHLVRLNTKI